MASTQAPSTTTTTPPPPTTTKRLYILRGISGNGKSTLSRSILRQEHIFPAQNSDNHENSTCSSSSVADELEQLFQKHVLSTDDYFINPRTQSYEFDGSKLGRAHEWNQNRVKQCMIQHQPIIIVDNTNTQRWEARPYVLLAQEHGYEIVVKEPDTPWRRDAGELAKRNVHGVPLEAIERMLGRWDEDFSIEAILNSKPPRGKGGGGRGRGRGRGGGNGASGASGGAGRGGGRGGGNAPSS